MTDNEYSKIVAPEGAIIVDLGHETVKVVIEKPTIVKVKSSNPNEYLLSELSEMDDIEVRNFIGGIEIPAAMARSECPENFFDRLKPSMVEEEYTETVVTFNEETGEEVVSEETLVRMIPEMKDGEPVMVPMLIEEYRKCTYSLDGTTALMFLPKVDSNGNYVGGCDNNDFKYMAKMFGDSLLIKSEYFELLKSEKYTEVISND